MLDGATGAEKESTTERREVVVSAGGGGVGIELLATALAAREATSLRDLTWRVLAGPNIPDAGMERLTRAAGTRAIVERARVDFAALLRHALVSVSQAGYNTTLDVVTSGARPVFVPFTGRGETEQAMRGTRLQALGLGVVVDDRDLDPAKLAHAVDEAAGRSRWGRWTFDSDGATRTAQIVAAMVGLAEAAPATPSRAAADSPAGTRGDGGTSTPPGRSGASGGEAGSAWAALEQELDAWQGLHRRATLWCRDDDACRDTPALRRLADLARQCDVPIALAVIPAALEASLVAAVADCPQLTFLQHGYAHHNHAPAAERSCELGPQRPVAASVAELAAGRRILGAAFGARLVATLVPPWNRIDRAIIAALPPAGFTGLSTFGPRPTRSPTEGLVQCNTHVDLIAWRSGRTFIGVDRAIARLVLHLAARREGSVDAGEPTGILTHHLDLGENAWAFLQELFRRTRNHPGANWMRADEVFTADEDAAAPLTSGR